MPRPDVVVIGAGMVGTLVAYSLAQSGCKVTLVDSAFAGGGSTGAAMGHLVAMDDSSQQLALTAHSIARWQELARQLPSECEVEWRGTVWIAAEERELERGAARLQGYNRAGVAAELLDARRLRELEPSLRPGLCGGLLVPGDGVCYPPAIARYLSERLKAMGNVVRERVAVAELTSDGVILQGGEQVSAGAVVLATGVLAPRLIPRLPIIPRRGHLVITDCHPGMVRHQLVELGYLQSAHSFSGASVAFNLQPRRNGQLLIGSSRELVGFSPGLNRALLNRMITRAVELVPPLRGVRVIRSWTGFRPATPDKLPLIGRWPEYPRLWVAAGHEGLGITMATGTADLIVASVTGSPSPCDPTAFLPDRRMPSLDEVA